MNRVFLIGRLVANPEFKITENDKKICTFRIAINSKSNTIFMNIITFDKVGESCQKYLQKASMVLVEGRIDIRKYNEKDYYSIVANNVQFLNNTKI